MVIIIFHFMVFLAITAVSEFILVMIFKDKLNSHSADPKGMFVDESD